MDPDPTDPDVSLDPDRDARIRASFARQGLMRTIGARIDRLAPGHARLSAPITAAITQQHGFAHAGASFALGDSAAGYAALSVMPPDAEVLTVEMKVNLIAPAAGDRLTAIGDVVKAGRRLVVVRARLQTVARDAAPRDVALMLGTMIPA